MKSDEFFRVEEILQSIGEAFVSFDTHWRYTYLNDKALELMQKSREELIGKVLWEVYPDIVGSIFETEFRKVMNDRVPSFFETFYVPRNLWIELRAYPIKSGIVVYYSDISKYKRKLDEIKSLNQMLEKIVSDKTREIGTVAKELESFSYSVSHDLRAPLRAIDGYVKILVEDFLPELNEEARRLIERIVYNSKKMGNLIDDLLGFSRISKRELLIGCIPMKKIVQNIWDESEKNSAIIQFVLQELPDATADSFAMKQVWINLISNAIKYTSKKSKPVIEIGFEEDEESVIYFIKDNGDGFDMQYYGKLFGVFQRLHSQDKFEGTGVGLAVVHRIMSKHGGKVWANASPNVGATFYISLPKYCAVIGPKEP